MAPGLSDAYLVSPETPKYASVLALLFYHKRELSILYIKRATKYKGDKHKGQISFPGGQKNLGESDVECALRETLEEVGLQIDKDLIIGELSEIYVFVSNFLVKPYVAFYEGKLDLILEENEVDDVIIWPVKQLLQGHKFTNITVRERILRNTPYYPLNDEVLWGATAMMTSELLEIIQKLDT